MSDPLAPFYDRELLDRLEAEGRWSLDKGVEAEQLRQKGVCDERTMVPAGLLPEALFGRLPGPPSHSRPAVIPPGRLAHGASLNLPEEDPGYDH